MKAAHRLVAVLVAAVLCVGCGYTSNYVPPRDGYARPVLSGADVKFVAPRVDEECLRDLANSLNIDVSDADAGELHRVWIHGGFNIGSSFGFGGGGGGGGGGSGGGGDKAGLVVAVIALVLLPAITAWLIFVSPESESESRFFIDVANAFNDLVRDPQSPCYAEAT